MDSVFASFFLLSFTRVLFQLMFLLVFQKILYVDYSTGDFIESDFVVEFDLSVPYGSKKQMIFASISDSVLLSCIFNFLPTFLLILYPFRFFQGLLSRYRRLQIPLVRKFNSCYRDGQDDGKDMHEELCWTLLKAHKLLFRGVEICAVRFVFKLHTHILLQVMI